MWLLLHTHMLLGSNDPCMSYPKVLFSSVHVVDFLNGKLAKDALVTL